MKEVIVKLTGDHIKVKGGEYVRDYQHGKWKIEETESVWGKGYMLTCSECGDTFRVTENALSHEHFCRNCGADMREREGE